MELAIGWLAPPHCISCGEEGSPLCNNCACTLVIPFDERCWRCNSLSPASKTCATCRHSGSPTNVWITTDHDGVARDLLSLYKFGHQRAAADPISRLMVETFEKYADNSREYLIVPVPTATSRVRQRGFGHSELLARKMSVLLGMPHGHILHRLDQTRQLGSRREDRLQQLRNSFAVMRPEQIRGTNILLVDDVVTTGGTLIAASQTLRAAGARRVDALLFAKRL